MTKRAEMIKMAMQAELAKEGKDLQYLESELAMQKTAAPAITNLGAWWDIFKSLGAAGLAGSIAIGGAGGLGMYRAYLENQDSSDQKMKRLQEKQQYIDATKSLDEKIKNPTIM